MVPITYYSGNSRYELIHIRLQLFKYSVGYTVNGELQYYIILIVFSL